MGRRACRSDDPASGAARRTGRHRRGDVAPSRRGPGHDRARRLSGRGQPVVPRGAGRLDDRGIPERGAAVHRVGRDRGSDRRAPTRHAPRPAPRVRDRAVLLARRPGTDGCVGASGRAAPWRAAVAAPIDALPHDTGTALLRASVIGQSFWRGVLEQMGESKAVDEALEGLESRGLSLRLPQSQVEGDVEFVFKHALILDVAYGTLPRGSRRDLHAAIARYLEETLADPEDLAWVLAHHWNQAGEPDAARMYLLAAAE